MSKIDREMVSKKYYIPNNWWWIGSNLYMDRPKKEVGVEENYCKISDVFIGTFTFLTHIFKYCPNMSFKTIYWIIK